MIRLVQSLEKNGLIKKQIQEEKQNSRYGLTAKGAALICKAHVLVNTIQEKMIAELPANKFKLFAQQLEMVLKGLKDSKRSSRRN